MTKYVLFAKQEVVSDKEKKEILLKYGSDISRYPKILLSDPALKNLDVKVGDFVKITRRSPTSGVSYYYRVVINE
ncbi:MAG: DNA-directed RNA polymerase subunit H [Nitrospiraceae bacterium]|nr:DNA-directed RNA polymerase subunit H [Nitrospiraceae bacterium]